MLPAAAASTAAFCSAPTIDSSRSPLATTSTAALAICTLPAAWASALLSAARSVPRAAALAGGSVVVRVVHSVLLQLLNGAVLQRLGVRGAQHYPRGHAGSHGLAPPGKSIMQESELFSKRQAP